MVLLLVPLSVFFSAICLALAVLARSMKEGQYYMTPLYLVCLPLIFLTLAPGIELNLFYSLVPVTGVSLLLRALILGDYAVAWRFFLPVLVPTIIYGAIALRWAIDQFEREDVLFREAERFDLRIWVRHLLRDKEPTPNGGEALFCFALMITLDWFLMQSLATSGLASSLAGLAAGQVAVILAPPLAMALLLTSDPRRTLRLSWPRRRDLALAVALPLALNPLVNELGAIVDRLFPMSVALREAFGRMMVSIPNIYVASSCWPWCPRSARSSPSGASSSRAPARPPPSHGDRAVGAAVRVPPRPAQPLPATLQRDAPGDRPGAAGGPEREHPAGDRLPLPQQRPGGGAGLVAGRAIGPAGRRLALPRPAEGLYHWWWIVLGGPDLRRCWSSCAMASP